MPKGMSLPGLTRQSIFFEITSCEDGWMPGSSLIKSGHDEYVCVQYQSQFQTSGISTVIASQRVANARPMKGPAKQSSFLSCCAMDCFAALAMTMGHTFAISPLVSREVWPVRSALSIQRAQGMPGARCAR
jgi:hypothetical protein